MAQYVTAVIHDRLNDLNRLDAFLDLSEATQKEASGLIKQGYSFQITPQLDLVFDSSYGLIISYSFYTKQWYCDFDGVSVKNKVLVKALDGLKGRLTDSYQKERQKLELVSFQLLFM